MTHTMQSTAHRNNTLIAQAAAEPMKGSKNMERIYKTMRNTGAGCIAVGIIMAVTGLTVGIISIVNGALLLKRKSEIEF